MAGGTGNDIYYVDNAGDVVTENASEGTDEVRTTLMSYTLAANVENLTGLSASGQTLTGNGLDNIITGNSGNDTLDGGAGIDTLSYANAGAGVTVSLAVTTAQDTGGAGTDTISNFENIHWLGLRRHADRQWRRQCH